MQIFALLLAPAAFGGWVVRTEDVETIVSQTEEERRSEDWHTTFGIDGSHVHGQTRLAVSCTRWEEFTVAIKKATIRERMRGGDVVKTKREVADRGYTEDRKTEPVTTDCSPESMAGLRISTLGQELEATDLGDWHLDLAGVAAQRDVQADGPTYELILDAARKEFGFPQDIVQFIEGTALAAEGAPSEDPPVMHHSELVVLSRTHPQYPKAARSLNLGDQRCLARVFIGADGVPYQVLVAACDAGFHEAVELGIREWRWDPPLVDGKASRALTTIAVTFKLGTRKEIERATQNDPGSGKSGFGSGGGDFGAKGEGGIATVGGDPIVLGSLSRNLIDEVIKRHMNQIKNCYQRELDIQQTLGGQVVIKFTISADGTVTEAEVKSTTLGNPTVEQCIVDRFRRMQFQVPAGGGLVIVSYPFVFSPD